MREKVKPLSEESIVTQRYATAWIFELWSKDKVSTRISKKLYDQFCLSRKARAVIYHDRMMNGEYVE